MTLQPLRGVDGRPARTLASARELADRGLEPPLVGDELVRLAIRGADLAT